MGVLSEAFVTVDKELMVHPNASVAKEVGKFTLQELGLYTVQVWHLDFEAQRMTLLKEYRRKPDVVDELVEYVDV